MRRIDLFCKLLAPILISLVDSLSTPIAIWTVFGVNLASVVVEYVAIAQVCQASCCHTESGDVFLVLIVLLGLPIRPSSKEGTDFRLP